MTIADEVDSQLKQAMLSYVEPTQHPLGQRSWPARTLSAR
jgi:hypothetical protein